MRNFTTRCLVALTLGSLVACVAADAKPDAKNGVKMDAVLCKDLVDGNPTHPTTKFTKEAPHLYGKWRSLEGREGLIVRTVWIAEDVGAAAPPNTKIDEKTVTLPASKIGWNGTFDLSRPTNGWPLGKYRAEIWFGDQLAKTLKFTIE